MEYQTFYIIFMTVNVSLTLIVMLAACLCCKKKSPKNEFMGLEGMVKLKNPDDQLTNSMNNIGSQNDLNLSTVSNVDSEKRSSNAPHRSLPDIPLAENNDNGSELYETVADKRLDDRKTQDKSPTTSMKKQASVSQHSSISQADDVSSPYSRVKNSPHDYAKTGWQSNKNWRTQLDNPSYFTSQVCSTEHPYAQLTAPVTTNNENEIISEANIVSHSGSNQNLLQLGAGTNSSNQSQSQDIPAASAIAGMVSASQDLPYMTPPIASQLAYFSGDSQDSSKGYTSISVREPLANIMAQSSKPRSQQLPREPNNDSHYATVSDDSDETYAAIEDPNSRVGRAEIYTSGSETYAQIQPMAAPIVVAVEINIPSAIISATTSGIANSRNHETSTVDGLRTVVSQSNATESTPIPPPVDSLRAQMHSRQPSSSSNNSSMGNLGSPKPEKRQANSPLPPTPKNQQPLACSTNNLTSTSSSMQSGRNSVASVIEYTIASDGASTNDDVSKKIRSLSPSKDIEGMYAKVMKKNKTANTSSSQNNSPVLSRKLKESDPVIAPLERDIHRQISNNPNNTASAQMKSLYNNMFVEKVRTRSNSYGAKDHGYETIPADANRIDRTVENRKSDCYSNILQKERMIQPGISGRSLPLDDTKDRIDSCNPNSEYESLPGQSSNNSDPGYETLIINKDDKKVINEPNYEVLKLPKYGRGILTDDGYAKVLEKPRIKFDDSVDGYSKVKGEESTDDANLSGYSTIQEAKSSLTESKDSHNYASISETHKHSSVDGASGVISLSGIRCDTDSDIYMKIHGEDYNAISTTPLLDLPATASSISANNSLKTSSNTLNNISTSTSSHQTLSSNYESLTGSESDPNYESVCYFNKENPYERLQPDSTVSSDTQLNGPISPDDSNSSMLPILQQSKIFKTVNGPASGSSTAEPNDNGLVDDYFHV